MEQNSPLASGKIPVLLLTGYLGSGKTTLLNRLLSNAQGIRFAVIVNDLGEVNIDARLVASGGVVRQEDNSLVALQNGCICCTLKTDLVQQLAGLAREGRFDYIVIEASGICEPAPIAQTIETIPTLGDLYRAPVLPYVDCMATVVDTLRMRDEFGCGDALTREDVGEEDLERLVTEQIEFCNLVLLNKASEVAPDELNRVKAVVRALNPGAQTLECDYGDVPMDKLLHTGLFQFEKVATSAAWIAAIEGEEGEEDGREGEALEYGIQTFVYMRRPALDMNKFDRMLATRWPHSIIRAKGLCYFADRPDDCCLFEQTGRQKMVKDAGLWYAAMRRAELEPLLERDPVLRRDWDPVYGDRMQKIVFIGRDMDRQAIIQLMDECLADPA